MRLSQSELNAILRPRDTKTFVEKIKPKMNSTETRYANMLDLQVRYGHIKKYRFEAIKLRLADQTTYTPDFQVVTLEGNVEFHEVKGGFIREDAWIKLKIAAELYPEFKFHLWQWIKGQWNTKCMS